MRTFKALFLAVLLAFFSMSLHAAKVQKHTFAIGNKTFLLDGKPFIVKAAEIHYPRIPRPYWEHRIKMCKALGMNTICLYVFWNIHEQKEGEFDFSGNKDVAEFCRLAQKNGMFIIVRPGPYVCAEWEMGGLPWWLLKKKDIRLRENDPYFLKRVGIFEHKVAEQLAPLSVLNGGPILMVQVENEYGSYGIDKKYVGNIRDMLRKDWGKIQMFQCDWASNFTNNALDDLLWTMNFGTGANIDAQFKRLRQLRPNTPLMCSEFWSGWFDKWGARHETRPAKDMVEGLREMLSKGVSFSLYMTHGGTSFGHWAGANSPGFAPDVTSYDYDAPINEYGHVTEKYKELRTMLQQFSDKKLPSVPKPVAKLISIPQFKLSEYAPLTSGISIKRENRDIMSMEELDMGWGTMIYRCSLPEISKTSTLVLNDAHDYARVFVDYKYIGTVNRVKNQKSVTLPAVHKGQKLTIVVEAMGRINFGRAIKDFKGITKNVEIKTTSDGNDVTVDLKNWTIYGIPDDYNNVERSFVKKRYASFLPGGAGFYRGYFNLKKTGDTFINTEAFGKGQVWINGHAIGRYWSIGPQQTLYVPGCWLKKGRNEVIVQDVIGPTGKPTAFAQNHPELDKLNANREAKVEKPDMSKAIVATRGQLKEDNGWQRVDFSAPVTGRYLAIEVESTWKNDAASIAELYTIGGDKKRMSRESWTVRYVSSEDISNGNKTGDKVYDLQESTYWSSDAKAKAPHLLIIDLGSEQTLSGIDILLRAEKGVPGAVKDFKVFTLR